MPKILINEIDRTTAGTPGEYSNNTVLICGFSTRTNEEIIAAMEADPTVGYTLPDENGVFEFYSKNDFEDTIGKVSPFLSENEHIPPHYGNQMAYELLKQGYPSVIYLSLGKVPSTDKEIVEALEKIADADTWEIFKDKASYDFRFVTHGLLTSHDTHDLKAAQTNKENAEKAYNDAADDLQDAVDANEALKAQEGYDANSADAKAAEKAVTTAAKAVEAAEIARATAYSAYDYAYADCFSESDFEAANEVIIGLATYAKQTEDYEAVPGTGRGDCVALVEINEFAYVNDAKGRPEAKILAAAEKMSYITADNGPYCTCTVPSVVYKMTPDADFESNMKFPGAFHYLACYKRMIDSNFAEWYAAAGYTRGVSSYTIDRTSVKLGEVAIQALEPRYKRPAPYDYKMPFAVNVIANFRGSYYLWGNRTCSLLGEFGTSKGDLTSQHFLNIRQLCTTIKKQLYVSCRRFTFDPNSDVLWVNFKNSITPTLDRMKADQGVRDYKIEKVYTDKKATLRAKVRIVPIEAVEDFVLEISLEDSLGDVAVTIAE
jgi:hypothetical protein